MNIFQLVVLVLIIGLLTKPLGFIVASIIGILVAIGIGFFKAKSEINAIEEKVNAQKSASNDKEK